MKLGDERDIALSERRQIKHCHEHMQLKPRPSAMIHLGCFRALFPSSS